MTTFYSLLSLNDRPLIDPLYLGEQLRSQSLSTRHCHNTLFLNAGPYPSSAHVLVTREDLNHLSSENTLKVSTTATGSLKTYEYRKWIALDPIAIHPSYRSTDSRSTLPTAVFALPLVDRRYLALDRTLQLHISIGKFSRPKDIHIPELLSGESGLPPIVACATYAQALQEIHKAAFSDLFTLVINGLEIPEPYNFRFNGTNAWEAFFHLLYLAGGQLFYNSITQTATCSALGEPEEDDALLSSYFPNLLLDHEGHDPESHTLPGTITVVHPHHSYQYQLPSLSSENRTPDHSTPEDKYLRAPTRSLSFQTDQLLTNSPPTDSESLSIYSPLTQFTGFNPSTTDDAFLSSTRQLAKAVARLVFWVTRRHGRTFAGLLPLEPNPNTPFNALRCTDDGSGWRSHAFQCEPWLNPSTFLLPENPVLPPFGFNAPINQPPPVPHTRLTVGLIEWPQDSNPNRPPTTYNVGSKVPVKLAFSPTESLEPESITWEKVEPEEELQAYNGFGAIQEPTDDEGKPVPDSPPLPVFLWFDRQISEFGQWVIVNAPGGGGSSQQPNYWLYAYGSAVDSFCGGGLVAVQNVRGLSPDPFSNPWPNGELPTGEYTADNSLAALSAVQGSLVFLVANRSDLEHPIVVQVQHKCDWEIKDIAYTPGECSLSFTEARRSRLPVVDERPEWLAGSNQVLVATDLYWDDSVCAIKASYSRLCIIGEIEKNFETKVVFSMNDVEGSCCPCLPCDCADLPTSMGVTITGCDENCGIYSFSVNEVAGADKSFYAELFCGMSDDDPNFVNLRVWVGEITIEYPDDILPTEVTYKLILCCEAGAEFPTANFVDWDNDLNDYNNIDSLKLIAYKCSPFSAEYETDASLSSKLVEVHDFNCPEAGTRVCISINGGAAAAVQALPIIPNYQNSQKSSWHTSDGFPYFGIFA